MIQDYLSDSIIKILASPFWIAPTVFVAYTLSGRDNLMTIITLVCCLIGLIVNLVNDATERDKQHTQKVAEINLQKRPIINENLEQVHDLRVENRVLNDQINEHQKHIEKQNSQIKKCMFLYQNALALYEKKDNTKQLARIFEIIEQKMVDYDSNILLDKSHPAPRSADKLKEYSKKKSEYFGEMVAYRRLVRIYEDFYPDLESIRNEEFDPSVESLEDYDETRDRVLDYVDKNEYIVLSPTERNQRALDAYISKNHKKGYIGKMFERFVGYLFEQDGFEVEYHGAKYKKEDLGRDLICKKGDDTIVVQCKYWRHDNPIHEKHVNQLFGTAVKYQIENQNEHVSAAFYSHSKLSDMATNFAEVLSEHLPLKVVQEIEISKKYPMIKCNIDPKGNKIYHLPFDLQYDYVKIHKKKGELYALSVAEAESAGFRRAFRWSGAT